MTVAGWTQPVQLEYLMHQVESLPDNSVIVEIGVWRGRSAFAMAEACRHTNKRVYAIDPWQDYETKKGLLSTRLTEFGVNSIESVYQGFMADRRKLGLERWIEVIRHGSVGAAAQWRHGLCDLVFIDGNHNYDPVMADLQAWSPHMKEGGLICGDDWEIDSVQQAVKDFVSDSPGLAVELPCVNTWAFRR
jgi:predicted O-methyltransferase YrrM